MAQLVVAAIVWIILALIIGASGLLAGIPPPFPQVVLFSLLGVLLLVFWKSILFRKWSLNVDIRILLIVNLVRFVGIYFLILHSRGELPYDFAVPGGWGDILVAAAAIIVVIFSPTSGRVAWIVYLIWNLFGFIDILFVVQTAGRLAMADPVSMVSLTKLPLSLLPTFVVPIIIYIHMVIFIRLWSSRSRGYSSI